MRIVKMGLESGMGSHMPPMQTLMTRISFRVCVFIDAITAMPATTSAKICAGESRGTQENSRELTRDRELT